MFLLIVSSGCTEEETSLNMNYRNSTNRTIRVFLYPGTTSLPDTNWFNLEPSEQITVESTGTDGSQASLKDVFPLFIPKDSAVVLISDSIKMTHFTPSYSQDQDGFRETVIAYNDNRNIFNQAYFNIQQPMESVYEVTYTFTEEDVDYAISINE